MNTSLLTLHTSLFNKGQINVHNTKTGITKVKEDIKVIYDKDPAANNLLEVILCYPGLHALIAYRFAHRLYKWHIPLIPRVISYITRIITGIEIHPAAKSQKIFH